VFFFALRQQAKSKKPIPLSRGVHEIGVKKTEQVSVKKKSCLSAASSFLFREGSQFLAKFHGR